MTQAVAMKLGGLTVQSRSHRRLAAFVDSMSRKSDTREAIRKQASDIRRVISGQATADGLSIMATPRRAPSPSTRVYAATCVAISKLRARMSICPSSSSRPRRMATRSTNFSGASRDAATSYPNTPRRVTASSVELRFVGSRLNYDLVPMLASAYPDHQLILKKDGTRRLTSVTKHTEFIRRRTRQSDELAGRVKFNECDRLLKWWRYVRIGTTSPIEEMRTTLIELLCASAYDRLSVERTYTETLFKWFGWLATLTARRMCITFNDYPSIEPFRQDATGNPLWQVVDPVNVNNNVVHTQWGNIELDEFASWFAAGRDAFSRLIAHESAGNEGTVDDILAELFGNPILTHGEI